MVNTRNGAGDGNLPDLNVLVTQAVAAAIPQIVETLRNTDEARNNNEGIHLWIERFNKLKPLYFNSAATPTEAEDSITHCEKMFQVVGCPDGVKARLAAFKLEGDSLNWWKAHVHAKGDNYAETCTWAVFRETFYKRYIPFSEQQRYEREYGSIHQLERENSAEYMEHFLKVASFVGPTVTGDAQRQARHYKWGLNHWELDHILERENSAEYMEHFLKVASFVGPTVTGDAQRQARHYKWGLNHWELDHIVNTDYDDVSMVCDAAHNIELLHETGLSNKRNRDGDRIQSGSSGQQNRGSDHPGRSEKSFDHHGRSDRQYEHRGQFNQGHDQGRQVQRGSDYRSSGRQGDRSGNTNQRQFSKGNQQNRYSGSGSSHQQYRSGNSSGQQKRAEILPPPPTCPSCGKAHSGTCHRVSGTCFECGSLDHKVKFCPKVTSIVAAGSSQPSSSSGRVYSVTREQADKASGTITGFLHIGDYTAFVLFDTGATHSIISVTFSKKLKLTPTPLINPISISKPMKINVTIDQEFIDCPLRFDDRIRPANLFPLDMFDFDLILGMDWLTSHRATIVCHEWKPKILHDLELMEVEFCLPGRNGYWASLKVESNLILKIKEAQRDDGELWAIVQNVEEGNSLNFGLTMTTLFG
ncbi:hypothetical protein CTI12_AA101280 [Artemisia annua]|uniref:Retrotransposon gag domain-containing protein n=1 Tax=Artemisia annua TaxID=35608 RepID=A0A2U1PX03_ARTAN|nr:hypothetical protein CTI12_AA101280 [Artemisia annua]